MGKKWEILNKETLFRSKYVHLQDWEVRLPSAKNKKFTLAEGRDFMVMVGVTPDNKILVIRQHYVNEKRKIYSLVAGYIDEGETKAVAAKRELLEETGYDCKKAVYLGRSNKGKYTTGYAHYFLGLGVEWRSKQALEEAEDIDPVLISKKFFEELINDHKFLDVYTEVCARRALEYLNKNKNI